MERTSLLKSDEKSSKWKKESSRTVMYETWIMPLVAELIGQCMFTFMHSMSVNTIGIDKSVLSNPLLPAITDGLYVTLIVSTIGHISGGHVNAAISTGVFLSGGMRPIMYPLYVIVQLIGSVIGAYVAYAINGQASGAFELGVGVSWERGMFCEMMLTFLLVLAVILTAVDQKSILAPFAIGFVVLIGILSGVSISGASMNPTLSFGPAIVSGKWDNYWVWWAGPILGAMLAALVHRLLLGGRDKRLFLKDGDDEFDEEMAE